LLLFSSSKGHKTAPEPSILRQRGSPSCIRSLDPPSTKLVTLFTQPKCSLVALMVTFLRCPHSTPRLLPFEPAHPLYGSIFLVLSSRPPCLFKISFDVLDSMLNSFLSIAFFFPQKPFSMVRPTGGFFCPVVAPFTSPACYRLFKCQGLPPRSCFRRLLTNCLELLPGGTPRFPLSDGK